MKNKKSFIMAILFLLPGQERAGADRNGMPGVLFRHGGPTRFCGFLRADYV